MGPRSIDRGNVGPGWPLTHTCPTSMGPRSIDRGNDASEDGTGRGTVTSMGPRSIDRGNGTRVLLVENGRPTSMGPRSIDRGNKAVLDRKPGRPRLLQWGRDRSIAEITPYADRRIRSAANFNGAAIDR